MRKGFKDVQINYWPGFIRPLPNLKTLLFTYITTFAQPPNKHLSYTGCTNGRKKCPHFLLHCNYAWKHSAPGARSLAPEYNGLKSKSYINDVKNNFVADSDWLVKNKTLNVYLNSISSYILNEILAFFHRILRKAKTFLIRASEVLFVCFFKT